MKRVKYKNACMLRWWCATHATSARCKTKTCYWLRGEKRVHRSLVRLVHTRTAQGGGGRHHRSDRVGHQPNRTGGRALQLAAMQKRVVAADMGHGGRHRVWHVDGRWCRRREVETTAAAATRTVLQIGGGRLLSGGRNLANLLHHRR